MRARRPVPPLPRAALLQVPSIFGRALDEAESMVVKAMKPMLDNSIFADRRKEAAAKDYFDVASLRDKMFKADWARIDKKKSFVEFKKKVRARHDADACEDGVRGLLWCETPTPLVDRIDAVVQPEMDSGDIGILDVFFRAIPSCTLCTTRTPSALLLWSVGARSDQPTRIRSKFIGYSAG